MINIIGIKCKDRFFVTKVIQNNYRTYFPLNDLIINSEPVKKTFHPNWSVIKEEPKTVQMYVRQPDINHRFELSDPTLESDKIKLVLKRDEVLENINGELDWKEKFSSYKSLYKSISDKCPNVLENADFTYKTIMEVNEIREYKGFRYDVQKTRWRHEGLTKLTESEVQHQLIDEIVFPDILLPAKPCSLTSQKSFDIIREYVKQHINYKIATITSDYNFCFTVKKKILAVEPEKHIVNTTNSWVEAVKCFDMAPKEYQNYKIIAGFRGKNHEDLKNNIDNYCKALIKFINKPLIKCPNCKGYGVINYKTFLDK